MASQRTHTTDHETIRRWAEERGGKPATVRRTASNGEPGLLRINFPGYAEDSLEDITWDEFFEKFDEKNLAMLYQDETADGQKSRFCKFVTRETAENDEHRSSGHASHTSHTGDDKHSSHHV